MTEEDWVDTPPSPSSLEHSANGAFPDISSATLLYRDKSVLKIGDVNRYIIRYKQQNHDTKEIFIRVKNIERPPIRAIHLLNGPFILYCHVVPCNYDAKTKFDEETPQEVIFDNEIQPGHSFKVPLVLNKNSLYSEQDGIYQWEIDVISQIVVSRHTSINYDFTIGNGPKFWKHIDVEASKLEVNKKDTEQLWNTQPPAPDSPVHLVILTHGLFSNLTADMLYLKNSLEQCGGNLLIRGYLGNAGRTEKGVKTLGIATGQYIMDLIEHLQKDYKITKISFLGHSLGGLVQLAAIKYILLTKGAMYFQSRGISPHHLICMASPLLGILSEMSILISWVLDLGTLGKTGRDLTLSKRIHEEDGKSTFKPLLETLPDDPLQTFLGEFKHLTVYANAVNDGIVPLRTASLLYLDWSALGDVNELKKGNVEGDEGESKGNPSKKKISLEENGQENNAQRGHEGNEYGNEKAHFQDGESQNSLTSPHPDPESLDSDPDTSLAPVNTALESVGEVSEDENYFTRTKKVFQKTPRKKGTHYKYDLSKKHLSKREKTIVRIHALSSDSQNEPGARNEPGAKLEIRSTSFNLPPKASAVESALLTVICPTPLNTYIMDPSSRPSVIFHDKYYHFNNLPPAEEVTSRVGYLKQFLFNHYDWRLNKQVRIARKYHTKDLNWRKVLVHLPPDAHNNIIVRRRFSNGYGWGVVDHVCRELFSKLEPKM